MQKATDYLFYTLGLACGVFIGGKVVASKKNETIKEMQAQQALLNTPDNNGSTLLIGAVKSHNNQVLKALVQAGANVNAPDKSGQTPLMKAITVNNKEAFYFLIQAGANINAADKDGMTALMYSAICSGKENPPEMLKHLVEQGANVNAQNNQGQTALMFAAALSEPNTVSYLLETGKANPDMQDNHGNTIKDYIRAGINHQTAIHKPQPVCRRIIFTRAELSKHACFTRAE